LGNGLIIERRDKRDVAVTGGVLEKDI